VPAEELTCQEVVEIVTEYLDGSMAVEDRLLFEEHLLICAGCAAYLDQMRSTIRLTGALRADDLDPAAQGALLELFRDWKRQRGARV
jgi:predicted anti-sigma-YlaC factor YlaD